MKHIFRPYEIDNNLVRLGNPNGDGGYVICDYILNKTDILYTYGIANDISFELDFQKLTNKKIHLYDMTVNKPQTTNDNMIFHKEGLSGFKRETTNNFLNHLTINNDQNKNILLKIDVEFCEYEWIENTNIKNLADNTFAIIIEFHDLKQNRFKTAVNRLKEYYNIIWIHGNNCGGNGFQSGKDIIPNVIEMTMIKNDAKIFKKLTKKTFPLKIDVSNCNKKDYTISYNENYIKLI